MICKQCQNPDLKGMHTCEKRRKHVEPETQAVITREQRKTMIDTLPRAVPEFEEPTKQSEEIAKKASRILGYRGLLTFNAGGKLQAILESLEIEIIDPKAVFEYQSKFGRATFNKPIIFSNVAAEEDTDEEDDDEEEDEQDEEDDAPIRSRVGRYSWVRVPVNTYPKAIPEFVIAKAIQIKEALPEVKIFVEELQYDPDPFLVVTCKNDNFTEQFYVEVWEEPQFEGRFLGVPAGEKEMPRKKSKIDWRRRDRN